MMGSSPASPRDGGAFKLGLLYVGGTRLGIQLAFTPAVYFTRPAPSPMGLSSVTA